MNRYVAFLRGINVGGHKVLNVTLKEAFVSLGFKNIVLYKQSGNIIFETDKTSTQEISTIIENKLHTALGYEVRTFIRSMNELTDIIKSEPFKNQSEENSSFLITFLQSSLSELPLKLPLTIPNSTAQIILARGKEVFSVTHGGGEGALPNPFLESKLKTKATTRNINVIKALIEK